MTFEQFGRNLRGVNNGKDFDPEYLQLIYETIKHNEIILPTEHDNKHAFDYAWKELLHKSDSAGELTICNTNIYDAQMFAATWRPVVATLSYVFMSATDDAVFARVITGFDQCARIAAKYKINEALDHIVRCLSTISTLGTENPPSTALNTEIQVNGNSVMVSELAVKFGRDFKAQLGTVVLFRVITGNEGVLLNGWNHVYLLCPQEPVPCLYHTDRSDMAQLVCELFDPAVLLALAKRTGHSPYSAANALCCDR